jgi:hypothetical protein
MPCLFPKMYKVELRSSIQTEIPSSSHFTSGCFVLVPFSVFSRADSSNVFGKGRFKSQYLLLQ